MHRTIRSLALGNDVTLEYSEQGDADGLPLVCLHGVTDSHRSFDPILALLPPSIRAIAISQRGHGHSSRPLGGYGYSEMADDLHRFMNALKLPAAIVMGHSMGSMVAQRFAIDHPSRTLGLVLIAPFSTMKEHAGVQELWETTLKQLTDPVPEALVREFQDSTIAQPIAPGFYDTVIEESLKVPAAVWRATFRAFLDTDFSDERHRIVAKTLMVWGDRDGICDAAHVDAISRGIPHGRPIVYAGIGHAVHWEAPERFTHDLLNFVSVVAAELYAVRAGARGGRSGELANC